MERLAHAANGVLRALGFPPLPASISSRVPHPHGEFWLPIHPAVGERLGLPFASAERRYNCFANRLTHAEYAQFYLACRLNNVRNLAAALAQIDKKALAAPVEKGAEVAGN